MNREEEIKSLEDSIKRTKELIYKFAYKRALKHFDIHEKYNKGEITREEFDREIEHLIENYETQQEKNSKFVRGLEMKKIMIEKGSIDLVKYLMDEGELSDSIKEEFVQLKIEYFKRPFISLLVTYEMDHLMVWTFKVEDFKEYVTEEGITEKGYNLLKNNLNIDDKEELCERVYREFMTKNGLN